MSIFSDFLKTAQVQARKTFTSGILYILGESLECTVFDLSYTDVVTENGIEKKKTLTIGIGYEDLIAITESISDLRGEIITINSSDTWRIDSITSNDGICSIQLIDPN